MKAAGYGAGKYTGSATVQVVGANNGNSPAIVQLVNTDLTQLGFHTHVSLVDQSVMYAKYCGVPKQEIDVCPSGGWLRDFADPLTVLYVPFYGPAIVPTNNSNFGQVNNPQINAAIQKAALSHRPHGARPGLRQRRQDAGQPGRRDPRGFRQPAQRRVKGRRRRELPLERGDLVLNFTSLKNP